MRLPPSKIAAVPQQQIVDTRIAKAPEKWDGSKEKWLHFKRVPTSYVGAVSVGLRHMMQVVEELKKPIDHAALAFTPVHVELDAKLT